MSRQCSRINVLRMYVLSVFVAASVSYSSSQTALLKGRVFDDETNQPVSHANLLLLETGLRKYSDEQGFFQFEGLSSGRYTLSVHHIAYADVERILNITTERSDSVAIQLRPSIHQGGEIVVRGTRALSWVDNTPFPVEVMNGEQLMHRSPVTASDALKSIPGLSLVRDGTWETALSIRGMGRSNIISLVDNARIETANDIAGGLSLINTQDVERVETMKSPGSVLYGSGAFGGVVHFVTKRPTFSDQFQAGIELTQRMTSVDGGSSEYLAVENSTDRLALRLSGGYRKAGNTGTPDGPLLNSQYHDFSLSDALSIKTIGEQSLQLSYQRSQAENTGIPGGVPIAASATATYTLARRERTALEYIVPNISSGVPLLTVRLSRQVITRNVEIVQSPTLTLIPHATNSTTSAQVESQILPHVNDCLTVGAEIWRRELDSKRERLDKSQNQITGERPAPSSSYLSAGIYAQNEWHSDSNRIVVMAGARYDRVRVTNDATFNPEYVITGGVLQTNPPNHRLLWKEATARDESWSMNAGMRYAISPMLDGSILVATAFRSPSLEERYQFIDLGNMVRVGNPDLQPERSICLNAALRLHSEALTIQTDFFLNRLSNLITETPSVYEGRAAYIKQNIGTARLYGFELSSEYSLATWVIVNASVAYVRGQDTRSSTNLPQIPPIDGRVEISAYTESLGRLSVSCSAAATQNHIVVGEQRTPGYAVFDLDAAAIPLDCGPLSLTVRFGIQNALNRSYMNHLSTLRGIVKSEPGRNYFLSTTIAL